PRFQTPGSSGADAHAVIEPNAAGDELLVLAPGKRTKVATGLRFDIPEGYEIQVRSRSGLAFKHGVVVLNQLDTIDKVMKGPSEAMPSYRLIFVRVKRNTLS
ncbi:dUTP diphosphatase, partial [Palleronia sp.]|uniref:dUTP diphosphatase n=1 Tax=Palleronia sp. TaxID=1940284 RepID=UPI0035C84A4B